LRSGYYSQENAADKEQQAGIGISLPLTIVDRNVGTSSQQGSEQLAQASFLTTEARSRTTRHSKRRDIEAKREEIAKWQ